ncbi:MAG: Ppx/GppA family phosphatase [Balneolaceae bacterium]|nr:Ppx/GppA family phosphatase [Balneolaceae bacterium]
MRSSIDIGTNSVLLLVAELTNGRLRVVDERQRIPRLGRGVDKDRTLQEESRKRVLEALSDYRSILDSEYPGLSGDTIVTATSAVRDAANRDQFLKEIKESTGWEVKLLSGEEEAQTTFRGALSVLSQTESSSLIIDIGGGSTEFVNGDRAELKTARSLDMGSVRFSERFIPNQPPETGSVEALRSEVNRMLRDLIIPAEPFRMIGVAGTVTSIAAIEMGLKEYRASEINGYHLSLRTIQEKITEFLMITSEEIEERYPIFLKGRGDVILAGLLILEESMKWAGAEEIVVSTGGIRHGILLVEG